MSTSTSVEPTTALARLLSSLRTAVAFQFEGACLKWLHSCRPYFLAASEKAPVDCGLWVNENDAQPDDYTARLFHTVHNNSSLLELVALDAKTIVEVICSSWKGGLYHHAFTEGSQQDKCAAFIVQNPARPDLIALVPAQYVNTVSLSDVHDRHYGRDIPLTGAPIEPFPLEWSPFIMPVALLPKALDSLLLFASGHSDTWQNPDSLIKFSHLDRPALQPLSLLVDESKGEDFHTIRSLWEAFAQSSAHFRLERPTIQPSVCDFLFVHKHSGLSTTVELKRATRISRRTLKLKILALWPLTGSQASAPPPAWTGAGCRFRPFSSFDLLLCVDRAGDKFALLSRDELPLDLFWMPPAEVEALPDRTYTLRFANAEDFDSHVFCGSDQTQLTNWLDRRLQAYMQAGRLRAQRRLIEPVQPPALPSTSSAFVNSLRHFQSAAEEDSSPELERLRGAASKWSPKQFEALHGQVFQRQLSTSVQKGRLLYLGVHPSGSLAYVPWVSADLCFHDLCLATPMVFVNTATLDIDDNLVPHDGKRASRFAAATLGPHASIYIIFPRLRDTDQTPSSVYVVPSWLLRTAARVSYQQRLQDSPDLLQPHAVFLEGGKNIENFAWPYRSAMERVHELAQIHSSELFCTKRTAVEQFLALFTGTTFLKLRAISRREQDLAVDDSD